MDIEISGLFNNLASIIPNLKDFNKLLEDFSQKWALASSDIINLFVLFEDATKEFLVLKEKCIRSGKRCVFYGRTSTGKSALINQLLKENLLPTGFGSTSNRIIEIKSSSSADSFLYIKNEGNILQKEEIHFLKVIGKTLPVKDFGIPTKLFYSLTKSEILNNNFTIYDTPGLGKGSFEKEISELCNTADITILVISSLSELGSLEKNILLNCKNCFSKFNAIIIFSFFDVIHIGSDFDEICKNQEEAAENYLFNEIIIDERNKEKKNIFFLSALEKSESQFTDEISLNKFKLRQKMFNDFRQRLLDEMSEMNYFRKINLIKLAEDILDELFTKFSSTFTNLTTETSLLVERMKAELTGMETLNTLNTQINKEVDTAFKLIVECVIKNGKKAVDCKNEAKSIILEKTINETVQNEIDKLKQKVNELIKATECNDFCRNVITEVYFTKYFDYKSSLSKDDDADIMNNLLEIKKTDKIKGELKTGMKSAKMIAAVATGGISVGVTAAIDATSGIASLVTGKNISISNFLKFLKKPFHFIWDHEEENIKKHFVEIKDNLKDSLIKLPEKIETDINQITDPLKDEFLVLQQSYEEVKKAIEDFKEKSFIYL